MVAVAAISHLVNRVVSRPALTQDTIHRAHRSSSVGTVLAMHQDRNGICVIHDREKISDILVLHVPRENLNAMRLKRKTADLVRIGMVVAQVHHRLYAERNEVCHPLRRQVSPSRPRASLAPLR